MDTHTALQDDNLWQVDHPVLRIIRERRASGSKPGAREDGDRAKVGLAVEGGGMRGVVSAAMLSALEDYGFTSAFDAVYGCSSGAINSAYFLAGKTWYPVSIYYDDLTSSQFISFRRGLSGGNVLNLEYAFEEIMEAWNPLDYERVIESPIPLMVAVTNVDSQRTELARGFTNRSQLKSALRASAWLPVGIRGTTIFNGYRAVDGGVLTALPFRLALMDDCTHVFSVSTRPMNRPEPGFSLMQRFTCWYLERIENGLGKGYLGAIRQKYADQVMLSEQRISPRKDEPYVLDLAPLPGVEEVKRHEVRTQKLIDAARESYALMYCALEGRPVSLLQVRRIHAIPKLTIVERDHGRPTGA
ncbi:MAG: patatin-like phospholipase family protein [Pseudonocardiaceae bacterium]